jgi:16S rRNA processing protein RimM
MASAKGRDDLLLVGRIGAAHGIKGEVRIAPFTQNPTDIAAYGPLATDQGDLSLSIEGVRIQGNVLIARLKGITDRNEAERLNGVSLFVPRTALPEPDDEDDFYHADLIGLKVRLEDGTEIGEIISLPNYGAGDLLEVRDPRSGDTFLYPFTRAVVPEINISGGFVVLSPPVEVEPGGEEPD